MTNTYGLKTQAGALIVEVPSSSTIDKPAVEKRRRGTVFRVLGGQNVVQYMDAPATGEHRIQWSIPLANGFEYGRLYSASIGAYGDRLTFVSPIWGEIPVAFDPTDQGFVVNKHQPQQFGYQVEISFVRLTV